MGDEGLEERNAGGTIEGHGTATAIHPSAAYRQLRADARRNVERLVAAARQAIEERGAEASLDEIARRAGVGPGTLYRHFPTRGALIEAVYRDGVRTICDAGDRLLETEAPDQAVVDWLRTFVGFMTTKRALAGTLLDTMDNRDAVFRECHDMIYSTGMPLLDRAKAAGAIRPDVELQDLIKLTNAIALAGERSPEGVALSERLLDLALQGLQPRERR